MSGISVYSAVFAELTGVTSTHTHTDTHRPQNMQRLVAVGHIVCIAWIQCKNVVRYNGWLMYTDYRVMLL